MRDAFAASAGIVSCVRFQSLVRSFENERARANGIGVETTKDWTECRLDERWRRARREGTVEVIML